MLCRIFLLHFLIAGGSPRSERVIWKQVQRCAKKLINGLSLPGLLVGQRLCKQQCEREGRLVSRQTTVFALDELIPADEVEKGRSGELLKEKG